MTGWLKRLTDRGIEQDVCPGCEADADATATWCAGCGYEIRQASRYDDRRPPVTPVG